MGRLSDPTHHLSRLSVAIQLFCDHTDHDINWFSASYLSSFLSHRRFSSSLSSVAGSGISEPLSHLFITILGPSFIIGSSQKVTQPTTYHVCQQPFIYSVTIPIPDFNWFLASYLSSLFGLSSEAFWDVCHTHSTTFASTHSCILGICRTFLLGHSRFSFHAGSGIS